MGGIEDSFRLVTSRSLMTSMMLMLVGMSFPEALNIFLLMSHRLGLGYWIRKQDLEPLDFILVGDWKRGPPS